MDENGTGDRSIFDDRPVVSIDELRIVRDEDGTVEPVDALTPLSGLHVRVLPLSWADKNRYGLKFSEDFDVDEISFKTKSRVIRKHVVDPDMSEISDKEMQEQFSMTMPDDLFSAVLLYSRDSLRVPILRKEGKVMEEESLESEEILTAE